jgi:hypothetical protein
MIIAARYSHNHGLDIITSHYREELRQVEAVIAAIDSQRCKTKISREKTRTGRSLYSPKSLNAAFRREFESRGWKKRRVRCEYSLAYYLPGSVPKQPLRGAYREIDFVKNRVGIEIQFGKYAFMVYNVCAKMTIFHKLNVIDVGIEIVPIKSFANHMSSGVSYFEQFVWDLEQRGVADLDIPVLILGVDR